MNRNLKRKHAATFNSGSLTSASVLTLAALGVLGCAMPQHVRAQAAGTILPAGTLPVLRGVVSGQAVINAPVATSTGSLLTIDQQSARAIIDWNSFNIARGSEVRFNQPNSQSSALNRIYSLDPSIIQGKLSANGQILLINQNGILFDRGAQVNAYSLIPSTLNISNSQFNAGLTTGGLTTPAFEGGYDNAGNTVTGGVLSGAIQIGRFGEAAAAAPSIQSQQGGSIVLIAPNIDHQAGVITSPDGQVILAAGNKAWLALPDDNTPGLRGMRVEIEADSSVPVNVTSLIRNAGEISADRGNVTLAALAVNQQGRISASTAVQNNGSIWLQARTKDNLQRGSITFAAGSVTETQADRGDTATISEGTNYAGDSPAEDRRALIQIEGKTIVNQGRILSPGGRITMTANDGTGGSDAPGARIYLDSGSETSVAGNWADLSYNSNLLTFKITSNELKDSPDQKTGLLKGATVTVDLRKSNSLLDLSGYLAGRKRTVLEKTATGGDLTMTSTGSVIQRSGATLDVSGGGYRYADGISATTKLLADDGKVYDISTAPANKLYTQMLDRFEKRYERWGQVTVFDNLLYGFGQHEAAYVEGKAGGAISITSAAGLILDGTLKGGATTGPTQLTKATRAATLTIGNYNGTTDEFSSDQRIGNVIFAQQASDTLGSFNASSILTQAQKDTFVLGADQLFGAAGSPAVNVYQQNAFERVEVNSNGRISLPSGVHINGPAGGTLSLTGAQVDIAGNISLPAGSVTLRAAATQSPISPDQLLPNTTVDVRTGASISTAGLWINTASLDGSFIGSPLPSAKLGTDGSTSFSLLKGGSINIPSSLVAATHLEPGSSLNVDGGGSIDRSKKLVFGDGGSISVATGIGGLNTGDWLQGNLQGFSASNGGSLSISAGHVRINTKTDLSSTAPASTTTLISPALFNSNGFSNIRVSAFEGLTVAEDTAIRVQQKNYIVDPLKAPLLETGRAMTTIAGLELLTDDHRKAASVTLATAGSGIYQGNAKLELGAGAVIMTDPKGKVSLSAVDGMKIDGVIEAPSGAISLTLSTPLNLSSSLQLGAQSRLSATASFVRKPSDTGLQLGTVLGGGSITLDTQNATVTAAAGSSMDVSGMSRVLDVISDVPGQAVVRRAFDGDAGTILVRAQDAIRLEGKLSGHAASSQSAGGSFALELAARNGAVTPPVPRRIVVTQSAAATASSSGFVDAPLNIDTLTTGGFDKLRLQSENTIEFRNDLELDFKRGIKLDAPLMNITGDAQVRMRGANVALGNSQGPRSLGPDGSYVIKPNDVAPILTTQTGNGSLQANGGTIDLFGSLTINGVKQSRLISDHDLRLTGRAVTVSGQTGFTGSLTTAGDVYLQAAQIYPNTRSDFTISVKNQPTNTLVSNGRIEIAGNGSDAGDVYSAGGKLSLQADFIKQGGTIKAPLGELSLQAGKTLELAPGSLTSVSANGLIVPYGSTDAGVTWNYFNGIANSALTAPNANGKTVSLSAPSIDLQSGSVVDLSGSGDLLAVEFVPGSGGSIDTLLKDNTYAIVPKSKLSSMPIDADIARRKDLGFGFATAKQDGAVYDSIHIGPGAVVPEGDYVLLPGYYALLPDAYLVQIQTGSSYANLQAGKTVTLANGQVVVPAYRTAAGTGIRESQTIGVVVRPGSDARRESDYMLNGADFFARLADQERRNVPLLPVDSGRLLLSNASSLKLQGSFKAQPGAADARSAQVDISGNRIAIVDQAGAASIDPSYLQIEADGLSRIQGSILIGGTRSDSADGIQITTGSSEVLVANTAAHPLEAPELLLTASNTLTVNAGSVLSGNGTATGPARDIETGASGALIRLANSAQVLVDRGPAPNAASGEVIVQAGATLKAANSILIDATKTTRSQGNLQIANGGSLSLASGQVSLGETAGVAGLSTGLVLSNTDLLGFNALSSFAIKGYNGIDLYGSANVGSNLLDELILDTAELRGHALVSSATPSSKISAEEFVFRNTTGVTSGQAISGTGALDILAKRIVLGGGDKSASGFASVAMTAGDEIVGEDTGSTRVASDWTMQARRMTAVSGANQTWAASDNAPLSSRIYYNLNMTAAGAPQALADSADLGARLNIEGKSVTSTTAIVAKSGVVSLAAKGGGTSDNVSLLAGASIDASGTFKDFNGAIATANGGSIDLSSKNGEVAVAANAGLNVAAVSQGGDAGSIQITAKSVQVDGTLSGSANAGQVQGKFIVDSASLADFSGLNSRLNQGQFNESRDFRIRGGNITVAANDVVKARHIKLAADGVGSGGRIDINGRLDASSTQGKGTVELHAQTGLGLASGSVIDASGSSTLSGMADALSNGGVVNLATRSGTLDFANGATIDVRAGEKGTAGKVTFTVERNSSNTIATLPILQGTVLSQRHATDSAGEVALEANRVYSVGSTITSGNITTYGNDNANFVNAANVASLMGQIKGDDGLAQTNVHVRGATELNATGDFTMNQAWNLTTASWLANSEPGTLTLRAAGDLTISNALGFANDNLVNGKTWNIRLVGGADLSAANTMSTLPLDSFSISNKGNVLLSGATAKLRTGTGNIAVAAARDFSFNNTRGVVYTAGIAGETDNDGSDRWTKDGGNISIVAGQNATGVSTELITEWLRRPRLNVSLFETLQEADWWAYRPNFQQGIGALAGGDVDVKVSNDINNLSAMIPTTGRTYLDVNNVRQVDVQGGGDLRVEAGNNLNGGGYLLARGLGRIKARGSVGSNTAPTQLYVMGVSSGIVPEQSTIQVEAGTNVILQSINNPTMMYQTNSTALSPTTGLPTSIGPSFSGSAVQVSTFSTYSKNSSVTLSTKGGNLSLGGTPDRTVTVLVSSQQSTARNNLSGTAIYPANLEAVAFTGTINQRSSGSVDRLVVFPTQTGSVRLLADDSITGLRLTGSDMAFSLVPTISAPRLTQFRRLVGEDLIKTSAQAGVSSRTSTQPYIFDLQALNGSILDSRLTFPAVSRAWAGDDISNVTFTLQNLQSADVSEIHADQGVIRPGDGIEIRGPGRLLLQAGETIDLGISNVAVGTSGGGFLGGLASTGNTKNSSLPTDDSARLTLIAGVSGKVDLAQLDASYAELIEAGKAQDKVRAQEAVAPVFANARIRSGDINSYQTSIQTYGGSDIDLWAPGGDILVGLTSPQAGKTIGLITNGGGAIRSYLSGDFNINQGKVLTAQGGDILIYSSAGSIDAGRGAKTSQSTPPPTRTPIYQVDNSGNPVLDANGNKILEGYLYTLPVSASGSGIQTLTSDPDGTGPRFAPQAGSIYLFAPSGTIDAGEAGIVSGSNLFIAAQTVLNASNISASGSSVGVPVVEAGSLASSLAASGTTTTTGSKAAEEAAAAAASARAASAEAFKASILTVEVLGFGDRNCKESDQNCLAK